MKEKTLDIRSQIQIEVDTAYLYEVLAKQEEDASLSDIFHQMSQIEMGHALRLAHKENENATRSDLPGPSFRATFKVKLAKYIGYSFILSELFNTEVKISKSIDKVKKDRGDEGDDFNHVKILENIVQSSGISGSNLVKIEGRHKSVGGNALRAAVLGANDGLVSNLSLIMGVAGVTANDKSILVTGFAGLLAGAISMAMGEWLSVKNSTELFERQIALELEELENSPDEELLELTLIYQAKGIPKEEAETMAKRVFENKETALETLVQEELGIDMNDIDDSAGEAAITSFILFAFGAILPLIAFFFFSGSTAIIASLVISTFGLFGIGAAITLFTGKTVLFSGMRQVLFGLIAAGITYGIGSLIGTSLL